MSEKSTQGAHPAFKAADILSGLSAEERARVAARFTRREFERDTCLFLEGNPADTYYLIAEGQVKILQTSAEGYEVILHVLGPGKLLGALPTLGEGNYPASAWAMTAVVAYAISPVDFEDLLRRFPPIAINLLHFAAGVIHAAHRRLRELATERVERRVARTLTRLASQIGRQTEEGVLLDAPLSRQDLAEMTATTLYTVSRTLSQWDERGIIAAGRQQVIILDPHKLVEIAEDLEHGSSPSEDNSAEL